ncbi:MAG: helix-hairpin-helix domain-containing protein [Cyanobacteria bacterium J06581_3]
MVTPANNRKIAIALAFAGGLPITGPLVWLHKVHTGKYLWGLAYLLLFKTGLPAVACCVEGIWYLFESDEGFMAKFPKSGALLASVLAKTGIAVEADGADTAATMQAAKRQAATAQAAQQAAVALRDLERLRQEGLITDNEFEQKRRQLIAKQETQETASKGNKESTKIDANTASVDDWLQLPGLSIHQARSLYALTQKGILLSCIEDVAAAIALPSAQLRPWEERLQFCYYDREEALEPVAIDANTATADELAAVPGLDIFLGRAIVHYRQQGPYKDLADLQDRLRLTTAVTAELLHYLRF